MNESDYKRKLVAEINVLGNGYARRIEDRWAVGALDMILKAPDRPLVFAEAKVVTGFAFGPTERQFYEGVRMTQAGLTPILIGWKGREMAISPWVRAVDWRDCCVGENKLSTLLGYLT